MTDADATKQGGEPDGWVAWHPEQGAITCTLSNDITKTQYRLVRAKGMQASHEFSDGGKFRQVLKSRLGHLLKSKGYSLRPVRLQFLDEE